jgi:hypothetical protein
VTLDWSLESIVLSNDVILVELIPILSKVGGKVHILAGADKELR